MISIIYSCERELEMKILFGKLLQEYKNEKRIINIFLNENNNSLDIRRKNFVLQDILPFYYELNSDIIHLIEISIIYFTATTLNC